MIPEPIVVAMGEIKYSRAGGLLVSYSLGSCIALTAWDPVMKNGAMAHIVLPAGPPDRAKTEGKYANTAVLALIKTMQDLGSSARNLVFKMAGGANLLNIRINGLGDIGSRNAQAVRQALGELGFNLAAEDVGGSKRRTVRLWVSSVVVTVTTLGQKEILL